MESANLNSLLQPIGGFFHAAGRYQALSDEPRLITCTANMGNIGRIWPHVVRKGHGPHLPSAIESAGVGLSDEEATLRSRAEGLERYSSSVFTRDQFIRATGDELGREALDLDSLPHCSQNELLDDKCPLRAPSKRLPLRWVRGLSLLTGRLVYLPAIMVYLYAGTEGDGEKIWLPISTGCAGHTSLYRALISAALEVIERDAISIIWLQKLALPQIEIDCFPPPLAEYWETYQRASQELQYFFFDATTDVGIPAVYGLQVSGASESARTLVSCSTGLDPAEAIVGVMREMAAARIAFRRSRSVPEAIEDFTDIFHGASYMARSEHAGAFDFLLQNGARRRLSEMPKVDADDDKEALSIVLSKLKRRGLESYAVELSTDEALRSGMRVVRVLIPGLQPLSFHYRARYLGHPRLYTAPCSMGYPVLEEAQSNSWPQPFA